MKRAESNDCPATTLDGAFLSTAVMPVILLLGGGLAGGAGEVEPPSAGTGVPAAEGIPAEQAGAPAEQAGDPVDPAGAAGDQEANSNEQLPEDVDTPVYPDWDPTLQGQESEPAEAGASVDGYVNIRTRSRWAEDAGDDDHDLFGVAGVDYVTGGRNSWGVHVLARGSWGVESQEPDSIFYGVVDTYSNQIDARLYHAYVDAPLGDAVQVARFGRMVIYDTPATAYFDGGQFETAPTGPTRFIIGAYGGLSVHQFESYPSDQWMGGLYTRLRPWEEGQLRVDWMHLGDDVRYGEGSNDLVSTELTHRFGQDLTLEGSYSLLDGKNNDMRLKGLWLLPDQELTVRLSHYRLLEAQNNLAFELNPYYNILRTYFPYDETQLVVSKSFSETLELYGGVDTRRVDDEGDIGRYNRDYDRYYLTTAFPELLPLNTTLSLTGEVWDSPDNDIETWGLDLTSRITEETKISAGSYYSLYKYFFDVDTERENVRTFYGEIRNSLSESTSLMARYEYENEEIDSFHSLWLGVTWRF